VSNWEYNSNNQETVTAATCPENFGLAAVFICSANNARVAINRTIYDRTIKFLILNFCALSVSAFARGANCNKN